MDRGEVAPFLFILNILVPGNPVVATVMYWALDGAGDGEEPSSSPSAEAGSSQGTLLKMLERWGWVLGVQAFSCQVGEAFALPYVRSLVVLLGG